MTDEERDVRISCRQQLGILTGMYESGTIQPASYYKGVVCVAYEYACVDDLDQAQSLLMCVPMAYYRSVQKQQVAEDPNYKKVVSGLARKLSNLPATGKIGLA